MHLFVFQIWDFNGHCHHILMAGNGDPAEISQVLCLKRIIIVVGWDRYETSTATLDSTYSAKSCQCGCWKRKRVSDDISHKCIYFRIAVDLSDRPITWKTPLSEGVQSY